MGDPGNSSGDRGVEGSMQAVAQARPDAATPVVMKFGGSSVADLDRLRSVARFVVARSRTQPVVVVVSAMGKTTDGLVEQARELCDTPSQREMDMLLSTGERISMTLLSLAIHGAGAEAISLTGSQCGIITDHQHGRARIMEVRPFRILDELSAGHIVIVGGFQGVSYKREVTTLGRGGSDTTAVALAAALAADCEIYSDVDGIYSTDPRQVDGAQRIEELSYEEMRALSRAGAKVLHARAVELAEEKGIAIYARATPRPGAENPGQTVVRKNPARDSGVRAIACDPSVTLLRVGVRPGDASGPVGWLGRGLAAVGLRYLNVSEAGASGLLSNTQRDDADGVVERVGELLRERHDALWDVEARADRALVSCVGSGLEDRGDIVDRVLGELAAAGIEVEAVFTDTSSLAFLVAARDGDAATRRLHTALLE